MSTTYIRGASSVSHVFSIFLQTFEEIRSKMLTKGKNFLEAKMQSRSKIAKLGAQNINDGSVSFSSHSFCIALQKTFDCQTT